MRLPRHSAATAADVTAGARIRALADEVLADLEPHNSPAADAHAGAYIRRLATEQLARLTADPAAPNTPTGRLYASPPWRWRAHQARLAYLGKEPAEALPPDQRHAVIWWLVRDGLTDPEIAEHTLEPETVVARIRGRFGLRRNRPAPAQPTAAS